MVAANDIDLPVIHNSTQSFDPTALTPEAAAALHRMLDQGFYRDALRLPKPTRRLGLSEPSVFVDYFRKRSNCWGESAFANFYRNRLRAENGVAAVCLFDLFWLAQPVEENVLHEIVGEPEFEVLIKASVISRKNGLVHSNVRCIAVPGVYAMFDIDRSSTGNFVYFGTDSQDMVDVIGRENAGRRFGRSLDLCTGSGVQGLSVARQSEEVICTDLNHRALAYVGANALLNEMKNVSAVESNLFTNLTGRFDSVTANTPYVPMPADAAALDLPMRGGDLGIEFTFDLLEQLPDYLNPGGIAIIYTSDPIQAKKTLLPQEVESKFGNSPLEFTQLNIFRSYPNTARQREHFQKHGLIAFDDCILVIRHASNFAYRKHAWHPTYYWRSRLLRGNYSSDPTA